MKTCSWSEVDCPQRAGESGLCYYHEKQEKDLLQPVDTYLGQTEIDTLFGGRRRSDGRRLDHYTRQ